MQTEPNATEALQQTLQPDLAAFAEAGAPKLPTPTQLDETASKRPRSTPRPHDRRQCAVARALWITLLSVPDVA